MGPKTSNWKGGVLGLAIHFQGPQPSGPAPAACQQASPIPWHGVASHTVPSHMAWHARLWLASQVLIQAAGLDYMGLHETTYIGLAPACKPQSKGP